MEQAVAGVEQIVADLDVAEREIVAQGAGRIVPSALNGYICAGQGIEDGGW
ncbi:hypothetical protein FEP76_03744 [Burkholderia multivorans]|uniref:hypothetical protein n=1 Tax=Burkholderia multivorans TaxID=87883 RepID=UPI0028576C03|nr:hypothetical protein [Burkholderia multivorans]MDR8955238.1 hypothetical protein [Burkholderia multivorans]